MGHFDRVEKIINSEFYEELLKKDDFYFYRKEVSLLKTFAEGPINFPPTFKYLIG